MSKTSGKKHPVPSESLQGITVESVRVVSPTARRNTLHIHGPAVIYEKSSEVERTTKSSEFVYVNSAYVGSVERVPDVGMPQNTTSVIREQYWTCSKWPFVQRVMAVAVAVLLGAVIGLAVTVAMRGKDSDLVAGIFRVARPAPD